MKFVWKLSIFYKLQPWTCNERISEISSFFPLSQHFLWHSIECVLITRPTLLSRIEGEWEKWVIKMGKSSPRMLGESEKKSIISPFLLPLLQRFFFVLFSDFTWRTPGASLLFCNWILILFTYPNLVTQSLGHFSTSKLPQLTLFIAVGVTGVSLAWTSILSVSNWWTVLFWTFWGFEVAPLIVWMFVPLILLIVVLVSVVICVVKLTKFRFFFLHNLKINYVRVHTQNILSNFFNVHFSQQQLIELRMKQRSWRDVQKKHI